ncbi:spore coat protein CotJB [Caldanaerobacter sp.]|uniref:spore coat protein CotJB n=1 Tax=Caldanaerobacter sp. TaxID=2930036 RepID=UPI003C738CFF
MEANKIELLKKIMELEFVCIDLNLYLDTHPEDQKALNDYNYYSGQLSLLKQQYAQYYGPLMPFGHCQSQYPWKWVEEPWPWEIEY